MVSFSSCASGRKPARALVWLLAFSLSSLLAPAGLAQSQTATIASRISQYQKMIADAPQLKLTDRQIGGLWAHIASDYQDLADFTQSEAAYTQALSLFEHDPAAQEWYAITLGNLGGLYGLTGRLDAQENCRRRSLAVFERLGEPLQIARTQAQLAEGYLAMGKNKLAERYSSEAIHAMTSLPGATGEDKASALVTFAYATCLTGHCDDGLRAARDAMTIVRASFHPESFPAGQTHITLGFLEQKTGDSVHAEEDLREGIRILRLDLPPSHPLLTHALMLYRNFLAESHRDAEAKRISDEVQTTSCAACTISVSGLRQP